MNQLRADQLNLTGVLEVPVAVFPNEAISVAPHDFYLKESIKIDSRVQNLFPRKNWSSCIVFNCGQPAARALDTKVVNQSELALLHRSQWPEDSQIGSLEIDWNHLEDCYFSTNAGPKAIHDTLGGLRFEHKQDCNFVTL